MVVEDRLDSLGQAVLGEIGRRLQQQGLVEVLEGAMVFQKVPDDRGGGYVPDRCVLIPRGGWEASRAPRRHEGRDGRMLDTCAGSARSRPDGRGWPAGSRGYCRRRC